MRNLKRVLSLALALVMVLGMMVVTTSAATYTDADEITYEEAIAVMSGVGLFEGNPDGSLAPKQVLTREQAATIITRLMLGKKMAEDLTPTKQIFTDVATTRWSAAAIEYCYNIDMIDGLGDGTFDPTGELTGTAFAKLLLCAMGYNAGAEGYTGADWEKNINADALAAGLVIAGVNISAPLTREGAAQMILQALEANMVKYTTYYDYATGANVVAGPVAVTVDDVLTNAPDYNGETDGVQQFCEKYFPKLEKTAGYDDRWGRPAHHAWEEGVAVYANIMKTPVKVYTEAVAECDMAKDLKLRRDATVVSTWLNGEDLISFNDEINLLATYVDIGAQGRLTEVYKNANGTYEIVMIDQFLATVTEVTEVEYDKNGHIDLYATMELDVYVDYGTGVETIVLESATNFEYEVRDMLLVNYDVDGAYLEDDVEIVAYAKAMAGSQTEYNTNEDTHVVEGKEYNDAVQFNLDQAGFETTEHVWYFDTYGNLIGAVNKPGAAASYGTITSIYWKDSNTGDNGYAVAVITYMDGTQETTKVYSIGDAVLYGVEGKISNYTLGAVSSTKQYNTELNLSGDDFTNVALYAITKDARGRGLVLKPVDFTASATIETGVPALTTTLNAGKSTMFLVWDEEDEVYETYTGIRNVPTYKTSTNVWYIDSDRVPDGVANYVFVIDPVSADDEQESTYYWNASLSIRTYLKNSDREYYGITGGYVNGVKSTIYTKSYELVEVIEACKDTLLFLDVTNGYVTAVVNVDNTISNDTDEANNEIGRTKTYAVYAGAVADAELVDGILITDIASFDVDGADLINNYRNYSLAQTFKKVEDKVIADNAAYLYVIYTNGRSNTKVASLVYVSDAALVSVDIDADEAALLAAQAAAVAELKAFINAEVQKADTTDKIAATADVTTDATTNISATGWGADYDRMVEVYTTWKGQLESKTTIADVETHLTALKNEFTTKGAAAKYVAQYLSDLATAAAKTATVKDVTELNDALNNGDIETIKLSANITVTNTIDLKGKNLDGAGYAISAPYKMDADSGKDAIKTIGGKISNVTIVGGWRGIEATTLSADLVLENVTILDSVRALHVESGGSTKYALTATNCVFGGKLSWDNSRISVATFTDCSFKAPGASFKKDVIDFYTATLFDGCDFESGFAFSFADLKKIGSFAEVKLVDCTVDGVATPNATYDLRTADFTFGA